MDSKGDLKTIDPDISVGINRSIDTSLEILSMALGLNVFLSENSALKKNIEWLKNSIADNNIRITTIIHITYI